jgi:hypothetical protein
MLPGLYCAYLLTCPHNSYHDCILLTFSISDLRKTVFTSPRVNFAIKIRIAQTIY